MHKLQLEDLEMQLEDLEMQLEDLEMQQVREVPQSPP